MSPAPFQERIVKRFALIGTAAALVLGPVGAASASAEGEVRIAITRYDEAWRTYDVEKVVGAFAKDFEWTNEVGLRFTDKNQLRSFLERLFKDPEFRAGKSGPLVIRSVRMVGPDVAIVSTSEETDGQVDSATHKVVPAVKTNELSVMRRIRGRWLIVNDLTSDESHGI
jgi:uncharacterized protein (TIGR02246 family)